MPVQKGCPNRQSLFYSKYVDAGEIVLYNNSGKFYWKGDILKKVAVIPNERKDLNLISTAGLLKNLCGRAALFVEPKYGSMLPFANIMSEDELYRDCDIILVFGGDGTLLYSASKAAPHGKPILGINMGNLGFLTGCEQDYFLEHGCDKILDESKIEERMMIEAKVFRDGQKLSDHLALNDIAVTRATFSKLVSIAVSVDGEFLDRYIADGLVVSTTTGSTAYSLSAGGPIVDPALEALVITPICPHMLHSRPIVLPPNRIIDIEVCDFKSHECAITVDGHEGALLKSGDIVKIQKSKYVTKLIKLQEAGFYRLLRNKMHNKR